jgi:cell division septum initiation protein DivIVA
MSLFWHEISPYWQAILTLIVSVAVAFISWLQWQTAEKQSETARNRLRLDLFERRIKVYDAWMTMAAIAAQKGDITREEQQICSVATKGAEFLFNKEIDNYCQQLLGEAVTIGVQKYRIDQIKKSGTEQEPQAEVRHNECRIWFNQQFNEMPKRFAEFLKVEG